VDELTRNLDVFLDASQDLTEIYFPEIHCGSGLYCIEETLSNNNSCIYWTFKKF